jgi:hypothetical protein
VEDSDEEPDPGEASGSGTAGTKSKSSRIRRQRYRRPAREGPKPALRHFTHVWSVLEGVARKCGKPLDVQSVPDLIFFILNFNIISNEC